MFGPKPKIRMQILDESEPQLRRSFDSDHDLLFSQPKLLRLPSGDAWVLLFMLQAARGAVAQAGDGLVGRTSEPDHLRPEAERSPSRVRYVQLD